MYTIRIMNEFLHGPVWVYNADGIAVRRFPLVYEDAELKKLNEQAMNLYSSYYEFDSHDKPCWFNHTKEKAEKEIMLSIISKIKERLDEINDGSFVVEDLETNRLKNL